MKLKYKFTIAIIVFLILIAGISSATDSILTVDNTNKTTTVNVNATYVLTVNNTGNADIFNLTIESLQTVEVGLSISRINLDSGKNATVLLNVTNATSGVFVVNVTAASQANPGTNQTVTTTTTVNPIPGVTLTVDNTAKSTVVNVNGTYVMTVNNTGTNADTFNINIGSLQNAMTGLSTSSISLDAGKNGTFLLNVTNVTSGVFVVNVTAASHANPNANQTVTTTTTVNPIPGVTLTVDNTAKSTVVNVNATYVMTVNNTGTNADTFNLTIGNPQNAIAGLSTSSINLDAGKNGTFLLNVTNVTSGVFVVNVTAASHANPNANQTVTTTTTVSPLQTTINAVVRIEPQTLNLKSKGKFTAFISLPGGFNVSDIISGSVMCEGAPAISSEFSGENGGTLIVKFNREDLVDIPIGNAVVITVTGNISTQATTLDFQGNDTVRVINKGKGNGNSGGNVNQGNSNSGGNVNQGNSNSGGNVNQGNGNSGGKSNQGNGNSGGKGNQGNGKGKK